MFGKKLTPSISIFVYILIMRVYNKKKRVDNIENEYISILKPSQRIYVKI